MNLTFPKKSLHLPGLNGMRAIVALFVLFSHTTLALSSFGLNSYIFGHTANNTPKSLNLAGYGVSIFFTLSGFLITYLLLLENQEKSVNIRYFYIRRIFRIWPLYYLYLLICIITFWIFDISFRTDTLLFYIFLLSNIPFIMETSIPLLGHYWSIGVEEQFYIFWPWIVKKAKTNLLKYTIGLTILLIGLKIGARLYEKFYAVSWPYLTISVTRFHCMLIGAVGAILYFRKNSFFISLATNYFTQIFSWIVIIIIALNRFHIASVIDSEIICFISLFMIIAQITKKNRLINLENKIADSIGKISYGIYIIHPLVIFYFSKFLFFRDDSVMNYFIAYSCIAATTILLAYLSYEFFEKKFLKLKSNYSIIQSSASCKDASEFSAVHTDTGMQQPKQQSVVLVVNSLNLGGTEKILIQTCNSMNFQDYQITIICLSPYNKEQSIFNVIPLAKEINTQYFCYSFDTDYSLMGYLKLVFRKPSHPLHKSVVENIKLLKPDILHFHTSPRELVIARSFDEKVKKVFTDHSLRIQPNEYGKLKTFALTTVLKYLYRPFHVITVSEDIKANLLRLKIANRKRKIIVVLNAIDTNYYRNADPDTIESLSVIYVSRLADGKGHKDLIKAWSLLKDIHPKKLWIVGPDSLHGEIQKFAHAYGCNGSVEFTGGVSDSRKWLMKANIAVFPSYREGLPLSLLEKMAMELPVIAYDIVELASLIQHEITGILNKKGDATALADNIRSLFKDKKFREELGKKARAYVIKNHHIGKSKKQIEEFYKEIDGNTN